MICRACAAVKRPPQGSPAPHFCDACGFPLSATGESLRKPEAARLVAVADVCAEHNRGSNEARGEGGRVDPWLAALAAIRRL